MRASPWIAAVLFLTLWAVLGVVESHKYATFIATSYMVTKCIKKAVNDIEYQKTLEKMFYLQKIDRFPNKAAFRWHHSKFMGYEDPGKIHLMNRKASIVLKAISCFQMLSSISLNALKQDSGLLKVWRNVIAPHCNCPQPNCNQRERYRSPDGKCNNVKHPKWGSTFTPQHRYLPPAYHDGVNTPRIKSVTGEALSSARHISNVIHKADKCRSSGQFLTMMFMSWGQFLDHDFIGTPVNKGFNDSTITCCNLSSTTLKLREFCSCFPIRIPDGDTFFSGKCMEFVRSAAAPEDGCVPEWRNQINQHTSFIDGSMVYGATAKDARNLRAGYKGLLKVTNDGMLPQAKKSDCVVQKPSEYCFHAGDKRSMVVPSLTYLHLLFVREHNRIARGLSAVNPHWCDETLYQETRKIIIAAIQHITYTEYLPLLLPKDIRSQYFLRSKRKGHDTVYNPSVNPSISNVFGVAAFRFGHSQIPNNQALYSTSYKPIQIVPIEKTYNRPELILTKDRHGRGFDGLGRWIIGSFMAADDKCLDDGVRNKLFFDKEQKSFDLAALNIQRGRDHGIPGYNAWRKFCGLKPVVHFSTGPGGMVDHDPEDAALLKSLYRHPDDMDLYPAALSERHLPGGLVGPTFACLIAKQFYHLKAGDRFWYENKFLPTGFREDQLNEIKKLKLSRIVCDNTQVSEVQTYVFQPSGSSNVVYPCRDRRFSLNLDLWRESSEGAKTMHHQSSVGGNSPHHYYHFYTQFITG
ncbi:peroxidase-like protein [Crassostrea angulata]|uniref:peroxidase-like protein n=1 Tax=Magallana angulata TaxID=2784310 RepID=UPI0022B09DB2|nr:peroxidase-like protein [Crassostrea angulata]